MESLISKALQKRFEGGNLFRVEDKVLALQLSIQVEHLECLVVLVDLSHPVESWWPRSGKRAV